MDLLNAPPSPPAGICHWFEEPLHGADVRLRPQMPDDRLALAATGLPDDTATVATSESMPLVVEWHGLVWSSRTGALQRAWMIVGRVVVGSPSGGPPGHVLIPAAWLAPSVRRTRCMAQCHLTLLDRAFEAGASGVAVEGFDPAGPADTGLVEAAEWPAVRAELLTRIEGSVGRGDSQW